MAWWFATATMSTEQWAAQILGYITAILTIITWLPQCIKVMRSRNTRSISAFTYGMYCIACILMVIYGFLYYFLGKDAPDNHLSPTVYLIYSLTIIVPYMASLIFVATFLGYKIHNLVHKIDPPERISFKWWAKLRTRRYLHHDEVIKKDGE